MLDNLQDLYETGAPSLTYSYWSSLKSVFETYSRYLGHDVIPIHKIHEQLNDEETQRKYNVNPYPDPVFRGIMNEAIGAYDRDVMMKCFERIVEHIYDKTGSFKLDGWSFKAPLPK